MLSYVWRSGTNRSVTDMSWLPVPFRALTFQLPCSVACSFGNENPRVRGGSLSPTYASPPSHSACSDPLAKGQRPVRR